MADTVTVTGAKVEELSKLSPWIRERVHEQGGKTLVLHRTDFPVGKGTRSKWQFLKDLSTGHKMGYVENDKLVLDSSKGYTPSNLQKAADYFLIGKKGDELKTLKSTGYLGKNPIQRRKTLSHGTNKPRAAPKPYNWSDEEFGGRTRKNGKKLRTTRRR